MLEDPSLLKLEVKLREETDPVLTQLNKAEAIKKIMAITPLNLQCKELLDKDQEMSLISVVLENKTENYYYSDETLKAKEEEKLSDKGVSITVEDIFCDLKNSLVRIRDPSGLSEIQRPVNDDCDKIFDVEIISGVKFINNKHRKAYL